jgi:hypothetical protein
VSVLLCGSTCVVIWTAVSVYEGRALSFVWTVVMENAFKFRLKASPISGDACAWHDPAAVLAGVSLACALSTSLKADPASESPHLVSI